MEPKGKHELEGDQKRAVIFFFSHLQQQWLAQLLLLFYVKEDIPMAIIM